jgi:hypothetical protein
VAAISTMVFFMTAHVQTGGDGTSAVGFSPIAVTAWLLAAACSVVMLVMWIGALVRLGQLRSWGWFVFMFVLQLIGVGIIPMVAYAVAGPEDGMTVTRPSFI